MLQLVEAPLADHLVVEGGIVYSRDLATVDDPTPARFLASLLVEGPDGPPWHTIVTGLETGRHEMRSRFEAALAEANARQRARLVTALSACYSGLFGFRRDGAGRTGFEQWVAGLPTRRLDRPEPTRELAGVVERGGCRLLPFNPETGHVPVGHDLLLYLFAELDSTLTDACFDEVARFDPDDASEDEPNAYTLRAWVGARRYEAPAHAVGDFHDAASAVGFLNAILVDVGGADRFRLLGTDGELAGHGPATALLELEDV